MSKVLLIRHAQSANNAQPEHLRVCDPGITELGQQQALQTARTLTVHPIRRLYCSPFLRSLETTRAIAEAKQLTPIIRADIFEQGGCYSGHLPGLKRGENGMGRTELSQRYPNWQIDDRIAEHGWWGNPYESIEQARQRAAKVVDWLENDVATACDSLDVLVIHADFKRHMLAEMLGEPWNQMDSQVGPLYNAGMSLLDRSNGKWILHSFNCITHLPPSLLSM